MRFPFRSNVADTLLKETLQLIILIGVVGGPFGGTIKAMEMKQPKATTTTTITTTAHMTAAATNEVLTSKEDSLPGTATASLAVANNLPALASTSTSTTGAMAGAAQFRGDLTKDYAALATMATAAYAISSLAADAASESERETAAVQGGDGGNWSYASAATSAIAGVGYTPPAGSLLALHRISKDTTHNSYALPTSDSSNDSNEIDSMDYIMTKHIASHVTRTLVNRTATAEDLSSLSLLSATNDTVAASPPSSSSSSSSSLSPSASLSSSSSSAAASPSTAATQKLSEYSSRKAQSDRSNHTANFQHIGSQRIALKTTAKTKLTTTSTAAGATSASAAGSSSGTRHNNGRPSNGKKVESKYVLPKPQKTDAPMLNYIFDTFSSANKHHHHDQRYGPHFEDVQRVGQPTNMTVQAGSSIHLNCRISLLQDKTVSWVRRNAQGENALDLLTVGLHTYTGDKRYKMEFQYPNNWRLKIINVKKDDEAMYECQISTHPPRVIQINLLVNAPKVMIVDEFGDPLQEKYYEIDSTLQLSCVVRNVAMATSVVYWKHGEDVLNYDVTRGGISVKTELMDDGANSTLFIAKINKADSGNYTCSISEFQNFSIVVHILNGESFAELHHGGAAPAVPTTFHHTLAINLTLLALLVSAFCWPSSYVHR